MRKLLLLTNCLSLYSLLLSCQTTTSKKIENTTDKIQEAVAEDTITNTKVILEADILNANTSKHSERQTTNVNTNNSTNHWTKQNKTTEVKRIEHGSDDQEKLDSIKKAKIKLKK